MTLTPQLDSETIDEFLAEHRLPESYRDSIDRFFLPLAGWLEGREREHCLVLGINGAQGTGKSTLADFLKTATESALGWNVAVLSIDDSYLTRAQRRELSNRRHPLLSTRGVPGTHDIDMLGNLLDRLDALNNGERIRLPRFDKSIDDRADESCWPTVSGPVDLVILEGWCVGTTHQDDDALDAAVNDLEREEDADGSWRRWVNKQLRSEYAALFARLDALVFLRAPGFEAIYEWRLEQERKLAARAGDDASAIMNADQVRRFIGYYERLTRHNLDSLGDKADVVFDLDRDHTVAAADYR